MCLDAEDAIGSDASDGHSVASTATDASGRRIARSWRILTITASQLRSMRPAGRTRCVQERKGVAALRPPRLRRRGSYAAAGVVINGVQGVLLR